MNPLPALHPPPNQWLEHFNQTPRSCSKVFLHRGQVLCAYVLRGEEHIREAGGGGFVRGVVAQAADEGGRPRDRLRLGLDRLSEGHRFFARLMRIVDCTFCFWGS